MRRKNRIRTEPFTDLLFNTLLGFTFLFFITVLFINPISKIGNVNMKAEYIVTVDWKDSLPDDVDIWVQDPNGETVSYLKKDAGWLHLDRDDQGIINDVVTIDGEDIIYPINREVVTLRGIIPGEYILNLYLYENKSNHPIDVKVIIEKVNPTLKLVYANNIRLEKKDTELIKLISDKFYETREERIKLLGIDQAKQIEKRIFLQSIDINWKSHIQYLEQLRQVIGLRSYGQRDPLIEYKKEAFALFEDLLKKLKQDYIVVLMNLKFVETSSGKSDEKTNEEKSINQINKKVKRNEPCPCGSGKKYKKCCGKL